MSGALEAHCGCGVDTYQADVAELGRCRRCGEWIVWDPVPTFRGLGPHDTSDPGVNVLRKAHGLVREAAAALERKPALMSASPRVRASEVAEIAQLLEALGQVIASDNHGQRAARLHLLGDLVDSARSWALELACADAVDVGEG